MTGSFHWHVLAQDFNSPFIRNYIWVRSLLDQKEILELDLSNFCIISHEGAIRYCYTEKSLKKFYETMRARIEENIHYFEEIIEQTNRLGEEFNTWTQKNIVEQDLTSLSDEELTTLYVIFAKQQGLLYAYGIIPPLLDVGGEPYMDVKLKKILADKGREGDYHLLTTPSELTFRQEQYRELLTLLKEYEKENWFEDLNTEKLDDIAEHSKEFSKTLRQHLHDWSWLYYVYAGPSMKEEEFFESLKSEGVFVNPSEQLKKMELEHEKLIKEKEEAVSSLKLAAEEETLVKLTSRMIWAKPRRKDYQSKSYWHAEKLQEEIAKRLNISLDLTRTIIPEELLDCLRIGTISENHLKNRRKHHVCVIERDQVKVIEGKEVITFEENIVEEDHKETQEIRGSIACKGKVEGKVKIINQPQDMDKMEEGDILVSIATTPSIIPAMRKACAFVTDEGGLTCHAAIVSREMNKPCIVGTKVGTKLLKDGDKVLVDAEHGVVEKLE